jgi:hypothetical protein
MLTLVCVAAGLVIGIFFNTYVLAAACVVVALAFGATAGVAGVGQTTILIVSNIVVLQVSYWVGLWASAHLPARGSSGPFPPRVREKQSVQTIAAPPPRIARDGG